MTEPTKPTVYRPSWSADPEATEMAWNQRFVTLEDYEKLAAELAESKATIAALMNEA